jgi:hypothetical protein
MKIFLIVVGIVQLLLIAVGICLLTEEGRIGFGLFLIMSNFVGVVSNLNNIKKIKNKSLTNLDL